MRIGAIDRMQVEPWLGHDDRALVKLGHNGQHTWRSRLVDSILSELGALQATAPLAMPAIPVQARGMTLAVMADPGTTVRIRRERNPT
jgi:creatinine amidohydrolase